MPSVFAESCDKQLSLSLFLPPSPITLSTNLPSSFHIASTEHWLEQDITQVAIMPPKKSEKTASDSKAKEDDEDKKATQADGTDPDADDSKDKPSTNGRKQRKPDEEDDGWFFVQLPLI